jgi:YVTN family beta-propeller protein
MNFKLALVSICIVAFSCTKNPDPQPGTFLTGSGVFILNEGNFMGGNGSVSFYSYDSSKIYNDLFASVNGRPLGDVPNSMTINGEIACIVVNNSGKIEIINKNTLESIATVSGLNSPRNISFINSKKAYVTSMYSDSVAVLNLTTSSVSGYINLRRHSESIVITGNKAFISDWIGGTEVMVVNTVTDKVTDSIKVGMEPESMVIDKNNTLWVLCNGGWMRSYFAELIGINTSNFDLETGKGKGAWELGVRFDEYDVSDVAAYSGYTSGSNIAVAGSSRIQGSKGTDNGGGAKTYTVGLKWQLTPNMRVLANYAHTKFSNSFTAVDTSLTNITKEDLLMVRSQFSF